jgi:hypothetical protein
LHPAQLDLDQPAHFGWEEEEFVADVISVLPAGDGWMVHAEPFGSEMMFLNRAEAEAAARDLGDRLAAAGRPTEIRLLSRDGSLASRFVCLAAPAGLALAS